MANFAGVMFVTDLEAKTAQIIEDFFIQHGPEKLSSWIEKNEINLLCWFDYSEAKTKSNSVLVPFTHFDKLSDRVFEEATKKSSLKGINRKTFSLQYLSIPQNVALKIVTLGFVPVE